jgi:hypothetical protein
MGPTGPTGSTAGGQFVFVLRPGDPLGNHDNVYVDSNSLFAAMSTVQGGKRIEIDGSLAPVNWTANGVQDLTGVEFYGPQPTLQGYTLNLDDGVKWSFGSLYNNGVWIQSNSTSPIVTYDDGGTGGSIFLFEYLEGAIYCNNPNAPFFDIVSGSFDADVTGVSYIGDGTNAAVRTEAAGNFNGFFQDSSQLADFALDATSPGGSASFQISFDASSPPRPQGITYTSNLLDFAANVAYTTGPSGQSVGQIIAIIANHVCVESVANFGPATSLDIELGVAGMPITPANFTTTTGKVRVMVSVNMLATAGDQLTYQLARDGAFIGPAIATTVGGTAGVNHASGTIIFDDVGVPAGAHTWGIQITDTTAGHSVEVPAGQVSVTLQELL